MIRPRPGGRPSTAPSVRVQIRLWRLKESQPQLSCNSNGHLHQPGRLNIGISWTIVTLQSPSRPRGSGSKRISRGLQSPKSPPIVVCSLYPYTTGEPLHHVSGFFPHIWRASGVVPRGAYIITSSRIKTSRWGNSLCRHSHC